MPQNHQKRTKVSPMLDPELGGPLSLYPSGRFTYFYCGKRSCVDPLDASLSTEEKIERILAVYHQCRQHESIAVRLMQGEPLNHVLEDPWAESRHSVKPDPKQGKKLSYTYRFRGVKTRLSPNGFNEEEAGARILAIFHQHGYYPEIASHLLAAKGLVIPDDSMMLLRQPDYGFFADFSADGKVVTHDDFHESGSQAVPGRI